METKQNVALRQVANRVRSLMMAWEREKMIFNFTLTLTSLIILLIFSMPWGFFIIFIHLLFLIKQLVKSSRPITAQRRRQMWMLWALLILVAAAGFMKFYHYNYVANNPGQARLLKLSGLREFVCQGQSYSSMAVDQCGERSIWGDADWGITAYLTIYGVQSESDASAIADFMVEARHRDQQTKIPMDLEVYKFPRSKANSYSNTKIFHKHFDAE